MDGNDDSTSLDAFCVCVTVLPERACENSEFFVPLERGRNDVAGGEELRDSG